MSSSASWASSATRRAILVVAGLMGGFTGSGVCLFGQELIFGTHVLPKPGYAKKLGSFEVKEVEEDGLAVQISVIPDLYVYRMAEGFEELSRAGYTGEKLEGEVKDLHSKAKRERGKAAFKIRFEGNGSRCYYFLQSKVEKHVDVSGGARSGRASDVEPSYRFDRWTIIQGAATKRRKLMRFEELDFVYEVKLAKDDEPIELKFKNLVRYREVPKKSEYEYKGINLDVKQISLGNFKDLDLRPFGITVYPGKWKLPKAPQGFDELLEYLDK